MTSKPVLDVCPVTKWKKSNATSFSTCLFCIEICNEQHTYIQKQWKALKLTAKEWSGFDRYAFVYLEVDWEKGTQDKQSFFTGNVLTTCKIEVSCYRLNVEGINLWNHLYRFVTSSHQTQILTKRLLNHQAPSPSSQQQR